MAQIPQINNPITAKNYNYSPRQQDASTEPFDIVKLTGVGGAGNASDAGTRSRLEMGNRELIPMQVQAAKDPTLAVETLKDLLNVEVLNQALITGHTELYGKLEDLAKNLYVSPEQLVEEIQNQEQQNTMFSGHEFYDVLREVAQTTQDPGTKELIGNLLKSINFAQNKNEILGALRANLKFLSEYYSPNEKLSAKLLSLSQEWGAQDADKYFDYLKGETLAVLKDVSGSLLNDDKTQMLIPLITHNLSRYNNSPYMCKEYFNLLLTQISSGTLRESLKNSFNRLYSAIFSKQPMQNPTMGTHTDGNEEPFTNYTTNHSQNQPLSDNLTKKNSENNGFETDIQQFGKTENSEFVYNADVNSTGKNNGAASPQTRGEMQRASDGSQAENQLMAEESRGSAVNEAAARTRAENGGYDDYDEYDDYDDYDEYEDGAEYAAADKDDNPDSDKPEELSGYRKTLFDAMSERSYMKELKDSGYNIERVLNNYSRGKVSGMDAIKTLTKELFIYEEDQPMAEELMADFSKINTMQELIDKLNEVLRSMPDIPLRERLYGVFVDIIDKMSVTNELPQHGVRPPVKSTLDSLTDFIDENINHPALKSLDSFNAANLLQSLLNAPGVYTPLAHYILPLDVDGTKAFGELWVDNDENNPNNTPGTQRNYHLFLTFDVESIGRFELDMYALGDEVNIALLYPNRFEKQIEPMKDRVNKIVRGCGYKTRTFETAPLKKPHNLVEIFPKITEKRTSLNKRV